jgi:hypothetical protein
MSADIEDTHAWRQESLNEAQLCILETSPQQRAVEHTVTQDKPRAEREAEWNRHGWEYVAKATY